MQIVLNDVPKEVEQQLAARARREGKTIDQLAVALITEAVSVSATPGRDLTFMRRCEADAREIEVAHDDFEQIDFEAWK